MPTIQTPSALGAASQAAGAYTEQRDQNRDKALALSLEREKMANDKAYRDTTLSQRQQEIDQQHQRDLVSQTHIELTDKIAQGDAEFRRSLDQITRDTMQATLTGQNLANANATAILKVNQIKAKYAEQLERAGLTKAQADAHVSSVESQFATVFAKQKVRQGEASIGATNAGAEASRAGAAASYASAAASSERTSEDRQLFPVQLETAKTQLRNLGNTPVVDKNLEADYRAQLASWNRRKADYDKRVASGKTAPDEKEPPQPIAPLDFEATVQDSIDLVKKDPSKLQPMLQAIDTNPALSSYQQRMAKLRLTAAMPKGYVPPKPPPPKPPPPPGPSIGERLLHAPGWMANGFK